MMAELGRGHAGTRNRSSCTEPLGYLEIDACQETLI